MDREEDALAIAHCTVQVTRGRILHSLISIYPRDPLAVETVSYPNQRSKPMTSSDLSASTRDPIYRASPDLIRNAQISAEDYATAYRRSLDDPEGFWGEKARE